MERVSLRPLFEQSARQGIYFGILFTLMSGCFLFGMRIPSLSIVLMLLAAICIFYLPHSLSVVAARQASYCIFPALWMSGIVQFVCGALICSLVTAIFLVFVSPDFLSGYLSDMAGRLSAMDRNSGSDYSTLMVTPTAMQFVGSMFWATSFCGSVISLVTGMLLPHSPMFRRLIARQQSKILNS